MVATRDEVGNYLLYPPLVTVLHVTTYFYALLIGMSDKRQTQTLATNPTEVDNDTPILSKLFVQQRTMTGGMFSDGATLYAYATDTQHSRIVW